MRSDDPRVACTTDWESRRSEGDPVLDAGGDRRDQAGSVVGIHQMDCRCIQTKDRVSLILSASDADYVSHGDAVGAVVYTKCGIRGHNEVHFKSKIFRRSPKRYVNVRPRNRGRLEEVQAFLPTPSAKHPNPT